MSPTRDLLADVARYYDGKVLAFGPTAFGVDWPSLPAIHARLLKLLEVCEFTGGGSINDLGCGWGAALEVLGHLHPQAAIDYLGIDVAPSMVDTARAHWAQHEHAQFTVGARCPRTADCTIASGIFNVKLGHSRDEWEQHVRDTLMDMHRHSRAGFAANFMLPSPRTHGIAELYGTEAQPWVRFCETATGRRVEVAQVADLAEFTLLVR